ncbi:hypothetical protein JHK85_009703 [Glycine max]|nr:hypothetical protein JHK85_009703 [Glycine max]
MDKTKLRQQAVFIRSSLFDEDSLKSYPPECKQMKKANVLGITTMKILFLLCGSLGYAAFGDDMHTWKHPHWFWILRAILVGCPWECVHCNPHGGSISGSILFFMNFNVEPPLSYDTIYMS